MNAKVDIDMDNDVALNMNMDMDTVRYFVILHYLHWISICKKLYVLNKYSIVKHAVSPRKFLFWFVTFIR